ncbi:hypothetical protein J4Q44_G00057130 [Coregonus suidteri]|uniref:Inward rectifier potassium channel C-terminal domain-containing protein n=1 Tax=Coregonus suidteri TaxID=861788 RepID=A0AAN8R4C6_9TELE
MFGPSSAPLPRSGVGTSAGSGAGTGTGVGSAEWRNDNLRNEQTHLEAHGPEEGDGRIRIWPDFELLVIMSATVEPTSATARCAPPICLTRSCGGYEFPPVVSLSPSGKYVADFAFFDKVAKTKTPPLFKKAPPPSPAMHSSVTWQQQSGHRGRGRPESRSNWRSAIEGR